MNDSIGTQLKNARVKMGLSLDQVSKQIHIRARYLEALENDQPDELPSEVQGRGFLHLYADFLNIAIQSVTKSPNGETITDLTDQISNQDTQARVFEGASAKKDFNLLEGDIPHSDSIFYFVGTKLQQQRESLGLSLEDIERYTHVKKHYLEAIENGRINLLPSTVQGRGMISNYANFLEMDADELLLKFAEGLQLQREERIKSEKLDRTKSRQTFIRIPPWRRLISTDLLIVSILVLSLMGFSIWSLIRVSRDRENQTEPSAPSISEMLLSTEMAPISLTSTIVPQETTTPQNPDNAPEVSEDIIVNTPVEGIPNLDNLPLQEYIIANQRAWMRVTVDGKVSFEGRVLPGNAYPFSGSRKIELLTGNGSALQVYFNQTDLGVLGNVGQVSDRIFSFEGVQTPTPQFSPTPTSTLAPTLTLMPTPTIPTSTVTPYIP
jgi:cytoskeleton protein RodZ